MSRGLTAGQISRDIKVPGFGDTITTSVLSASTTEEVISIANPGSVIAWQSKDTLAANIEISLNGTDYISAGTATAAGISSFNTHPVRFVKVTRTGGEGKLVLVVR